MTAQAVLTLNTVAYNPRGTNNGVSTWAKVGDTGFGGATSIATQSVRGPLNEGQTRVRLILTVPKLASEDSACGCAGTELSRGKMEITVDVPAGWTAAEKQDLRKRIQSQIADATFAAAVDTGEGVW